LAERDEAFMAASFNEPIGEEENHKMETETVELFDSVQNYVLYMVP